MWNSSATSGAAVPKISTKRAVGLGFRAEIADLRRGLVSRMMVVRVVKIGELGSTLLEMSTGGSWMMSRRF